MGNHALGKQIGTAVQVAYERRLPSEKAIDILDRFCRGLGGGSEWEAEDPNRPGFGHPEFVHYVPLSKQVDTGGEFHCPAYNRVRRF